MPKDEVISCWWRSGLYEILQILVLWILATRYKTKPFIIAKLPAVYTDGVDSIVVNSNVDDVVSAMYRLYR